MRPAVFFDRDGTLNENAKGYVWRWDQFRWRMGAITAIKAANTAGYLVIVVTNQGGISKGMYTERDVVLLHERMLRDVARHAARIDAFYFCPHHPDGTAPRYAVRCLCRKPAPGMLLAAISDYDVDRDSSFMVGDSECDLSAGGAAGLAAAVLVKNHDVGNLVSFLVRKQQSGNHHNQSQPVA